MMIFVGERMEILKELFKEIRRLTVLVECYNDARRYSDKDSEEHFKERIVREAEFINRHFHTFMLGV